MTTFPTRTIEEVTETLLDYRGKTPPKTKNGVKLITAKVIKDGFIIDGNHEYISEETYDTWMRRGLPKQWDILITTEAPLGKVAQLRTTECVALTQRVILLRGKVDVIDQGFYFYALKSDFVQNQLKQRATGTTVLGVKQTELRQVRIPYYPFLTQRKIASILSAYDDLIETNTRRIKTLEEMAQAIYREWFVHFRFPGHEKVKMVDSPLGLIPEGWKVKPIVENFMLFREAGGDLVKLVAKNHQYLGVNNAIEAVCKIRENLGRLGVFWHTQGSGKSYSMVFFAQKVLRTLPGNWTFLIVTDRQELDDQIYKTFASAGVVTEPHVQSTSGEHLKQLLREDHRYIFTLIQKFHTEKGGKYPKLSDRSDIIVITDEAHRSQYDLFALNMRNALPNAAFIGFTGTPLMVGEEKTREVFGDYVSIYNFKQSMDDGATVPLYYENRTPELQLSNQDLNTGMECLLEEAELDEEQEKKLEREFKREYYLITRDDRLEKIAEDLVAHFMGRGHMGKAMVVSIDKVTAVRMYDKVQKYWKRYLETLQTKLTSGSESEREELETKIRYMKETDMAVVISQSQNEVEIFKKKGLDIIPHRKRMVSENLDAKFKDPDDPFRIVFVCAMWMTGFDVPSCSTIYLDKPMRNHTLMQTIARANRVFRDKVNGLIVDYIGVFRDLQKALAIYGSAAGGGIREGETPIKDKSALVEELKQALAEATTFCTGLGIDLTNLQGVQGFERVKLLDHAVEAILVNDESKKKYLSLAGNVDKLYKAILPDPATTEFSAPRVLFIIIAEKIRSLTPEVDISEVMEDIEHLLDKSIATEGYIIREPSGSYSTERFVDLSKIDFEALKAHFENSRKRMEAEKLKAAIHSKLRQMVRLNKTRMDYLQEFQKMIDAYNAGSYNIEVFFEKLVTFAQALNAKEKRGIAEQLSYVAGL
jgi:type I restriction enzyme R subunit